MITTKQSGQGRFVSRLTRDTVALILAGGRGSRLYELTNWRAKPAVYFGGKLRIIFGAIVLLPAVVMLVALVYSIRRRQRQDRPRTEAQA